MKKLLRFFSVIGFHFLLAQTAIDPTIEPAFFGADEEITITYNVTGTSLSSLDEAWIWLWIPGEGDAPSNVNPASSNTSATDPAKFTRSTDSEGQVYFSITLTPSTFSNISSNDIEQVGMLLKGDDWADGQTTDYIADISNGFAIAMNNPTGNYGFFETSEEITISVQTSEPSNIEILVDEVVIASSSSDTELTTTHTIIDDGSVHIIKATANNGSETISTSYTYTLTPTTPTETIPVGLVDGINYSEDPTTVNLVLTAPEKENVFVIGDFNNWSLDNDYLMKKDGDLFWVEISGLTSGQEYIYQYLVDGEIKIADPYAEKISSQFDDGQIIEENRYPNLAAYPASQTTEAAGFLQTNQSEYTWDEFTRPDKEDLIVYELLVRDFTEERTFQAVIDRLDYLEDLGINAIELMPVQEFEGNISWGYNPSSMFAVDKFYGTELDFKTLVNEAHKRGMAIILDIVLNHQFGRNSLVRLYNEGLYGNPTSDNPWFNTSAKHDFNVGYDMNHESQYTVDYVNRVVTYWLDEYNIDGYRFDLSKGFTQNNTLGNVAAWGNYDASRVAIWKNIADVIWENDPTAYIILEHFADNNEETELANYGMMLWGNRNGKYISLGKGSTSSLTDVYHEGLGWNDPHLVAYMESHDEERFMWEVTKSGSISTSAALERAKLNTVFFLTIPGPKMIWQFGEFGYDEELNNDRLGIKPTRWEYLEDPERLKLFNLYKSLINLRTKTDYVDSDNFDWNTGSRVKTIIITHPEVDIYVIGNFSTIEQEATHNFSQTGTWYDYFSGNSFEVTSTNESVTLRAGEFHVYTSELIENYIEDQNLALSIEDGISEEIIYPNPVESVFQISGITSPVSFAINDLSGKTLKRGKYQSGEELDISDLEQGIYMLKLELNGISSSTKIIKK